MTEEIIIDCAFYKDGVCASPINKTCEYCKNIDVSKCYHKQLKRLEQERDDLQDRLLTLADTYQETRNTCKRLEKENKELKTKLDVFAFTISQYESALEEIRIMATKDVSIESFLKIQNKINEVLR